MVAVKLNAINFVAACAYSYWPVALFASQKYFRLLVLRICGRPRSGEGPGRSIGAAGFVSPVCCFCSCARRLLLYADSSFYLRHPPQVLCRAGSDRGISIVGYLGVLRASEYKINLLQGICSVRKQLQIYEQNDVYCTLHTAHCTAVRCTPLPEFRSQRRDPPCPSGSTERME